MRQSDVATVVALLLAAYPGSQATAETVLVYERMLGDLDADKLARVVNDYIATHKWFPTIAELRRAYVEREARLPTADDILAILARGEKPPSYPLLDDLLRSMGGRMQYLRSPEPERWRAEFIKRYTEQRDYALDAAAMSGVRARLPGLVTQLLEKP